MGGFAALRDVGLRASGSGLCSLDIVADSSGALPAKLVTSRQRQGSFVLGKQFEGPRIGGGVLSARWKWRTSELLGRELKVPVRKVIPGPPSPTRVRATLDAELSEQVSGHGRQLRPFQIALAAGLLVAGEKALGVGIAQAQVVPSGLPAATVGMLILAGALTGIDAVSPKYSKKIVSFFMPATEQFQRWMPLFYTPPLVMLPVAVQKMTVGQGGKLLFLVGSAWLVNLLAIGVLASAARKTFNGRLGEAPNMGTTAPFGIWEMLTWVGIGAASFGVAYASPAALGNPATTAAPFFASATVCGFLLGSHLPGPVKKFVHPVLTSAAFTIVAAFFFGIFTDQSFFSVLGLYLTRDVKTPGGGDVLMAFLGPLTVSYALTLFRQRGILKRHGREVLAVVPVAGLFSLVLTGVVGRQLGLNSELIRSVAARSVALPFAVPIAKTLQGQDSLAVAASIITGVLGANVSNWLLSRTKVQDLVARGIATACSSHSFGSASVAAGEPDLMPFCAVVYVLMGAVCSLLCTVPAARNMLLLQ